MPFSLSSDLPTWAMVLAAVLFLSGLAMVVFELLLQRKRAIWVASTALLATALLALAVLRPLRVDALYTQVGPRVLVLADRSVSMELPGDGASRQRVALQAIEDLKLANPGVRFTALGFGIGPAGPIDSDENGVVADQLGSDLVAGVASVVGGLDEKPAAVVVVSDGRLDTPAQNATADQLRAVFAPIGTPVHTVAVASNEIRDASIREVWAAGAAVAHQTVRMTVTVGCSGRRPCGYVA
ncbi:MAG: hypothetical protein FWD57_06400, partial [Polyangiaceae bacterium]|nr:hypothetical protein [Polyangiaceae bacterium]